MSTKKNSKRKFDLGLTLISSRNLAKNALQVGFIYSIAMILQFISDLVFGRSFNATDYGQISFIRQSIVFVITFTFLGIDSSLVRIISHKDLSQFRWRNFVNKIFLIFIGVSVIISLGIKILYSLSWLITLLICFCSIAGSRALLFSALLRANSKFFKAQLSTQFWKITLCVGSLGLVIFHKLDFISALVILSIAYFTNAIFSDLFARKFPDGIKGIPLGKVFTEGFLFWVNSGVLLLTGLADQFVIVKLLGYASFAPYIATWNIVGTVFILVSTSIGFVIVPPLIQHKLNIKSMGVLLGLLIFISLLLGFFMIEISAPVVKLAYAGKYLPDLTLIIFFVAIGITRLIYVVPSAIITAWGTTRNIGEFSLIGTVGVLINIVVAIILIPRLNLIGAVIGSLSGWMFRLILSFIQSARIISKKTFGKEVFQPGANYLIDMNK